MSKPLRAVFAAAVLWATAPSANANVDPHEQIWGAQPIMSGGNIVNADHSIDRCATVSGPKIRPVLLASLGKREGYDGDVVIQIGGDAVITSGDIIAVMDKGVFQVASVDRKPMDASRFLNGFFDELRAAEEVCAIGNSPRSDDYSQVKKLLDAARNDFNYAVTTFNMLQSPAPEPGKLPPPQFGK